MNMLPAVRALKFFDLEPESRVRIWFVVLTGMFAAGFLLPFVESDFAPLIERLIAFSEGRVALPRLSSGQWYFLLLQALIRILGIVAGVDYLRYFLKEETDGIKRIPFLTWFKIILFQILTGLAFVLSAQFFLLPYLVFVSLFLFVQPELIVKDSSIPAAMQKSYALGLGVRFSIAMSFMFIVSLFMLLNLLSTRMGGGNVQAAALLGGFLFAWEVLSKAKLTGILYKSLVRRAHVDRPFRL